MFKKLILGAVVAVIMAGSTSAQTLDEVLDKHFAALGGKDKIKAAKSVRMTGRTEVGPGIEAPLTIEIKKPNMMRFEIKIQGLSLVQAYDGTTGWKINPFQGKKEPELLDADELKDAKEQADMDGEFIDYKTKKNKLELVGHADIDGSDTYQIRVTKPEGDVENVYLDADSYLIVKTTGKRKVRGTEVETEGTLGDYKEVSGLYFPFSIESGLKDSPQKLKITIEKIELDPTIDSARFVMPGGMNHTTPAAPATPVKPATPPPPAKPTPPAKAAKPAAKKRG